MKIFTEVIIIKTKTVSESITRTGNLMQPSEANSAGNVHGGEIMKMMDNSAGIVAARHARSRVVTARVDCLEFHYPIHVGYFVTCESKITYVGKKSMEVLVKVYSENIRKDQEAILALTGYFTMVALDDDGKAIEVPQLEITNEEEQKLFDEGKQRYLARKQAEIKQ